MKKIIDIILLRFVKWVLMDLNVWRSNHISRADNNKMWYFSESLNCIIKRIKSNYT
jgi:hypothetical protein